MLAKVCVCTQTQLAALHSFCSVLRYNRYMQGRSSNTPPHHLLARVHTRRTLTSTPARASLGALGRSPGRRRRRDGYQLDRGVPWETTGTLTSYLRRGRRLLGREMSICLCP